MIKHPFELIGERLKIGRKLWVIPHSSHVPVQCPVSEGGDDQGHLGPIRPKPGGLKLEEQLALPQETLTLMKLPGVGLGGCRFGSHWESKGSPLGIAGVVAIGESEGGVGGWGG